MRALVLFLFVVASPIVLGAMVSGNGFNLSDIRQQLAANDFVHDKMSEARDYAMMHPGLVDGVKAHRAELQGLRSQICSLVQC